MAEAQRTARIETRIAPDALDAIRRAAQIQGRSVSDFIVAAAHEAAQRTIVEVEILRLSREAQETFAALLLDPPAPMDALRRAFEHRKALLED